MHKFVTRQVGLWVAMLGMLFGALAPALSHAMAASTAAQEVQICTMAGMQTVMLAQPEPDEPGIPGHFFKHCSYCIVQDGPGALPPPAGFVSAVLALPASHPPLFHQAPRPLFAWTSAHPRAPPLPA